MWKEFYIQSNIPLMILTIAVLCLLFIGYLEVKKINNRIDNLNNRVENFSVPTPVQGIKLELKEGIDEKKILNESESESDSEDTIDNTLETEVKNEIKKSDATIFALLGAGDIGEEIKQFKNEFVIT